MVGKAKAAVQEAPQDAELPATDEVLALVPVPANEAVLRFYPQKPDVAVYFETMFYVELPARKITMSQVQWMSWLRQVEAVIITAFDSYGKLMRITLFAVYDINGEEHRRDYHVDVTKGKDDVAKALFASLITPFMEDYNKGNTPL
jgi:hypothetical protein